MLDTNHIPQFKDFTIKKMKKEKIIQYTFDYIRLSYNKENPVEFNPSNLILKCERMKYRVSIMFDEIFRFDFTIVNQNEYSVEIEILLPKIANIMQFEKCFKNLKTFLTPITQTLNKDLINYIQPQQPHTMAYSDLFTIISNKYTVTDKADGIRTFFKITNNNALLINPKTKEVIQELGHSDKDQTLIDGEYVNGRFYAFDLIFFNGKDYRNENLLERLKILKQTVDQITVGLIIKMKTFYFSNIFENGKKILDTKHPYKVDGLIFTPVYQRACEDEQCDLPIFKWKIRNTVDVRVKYSSKDDYTFFIYGKKYGRINQWGSEYFERESIRSRDHRTQTMHNTFHNQEYDEIRKKIIHFGKYKIFNSIGNMFFGKPGKPNEDHLTKRRLNKNINVILDKYDIIEYEFRNEEWYPLRKRTFDKDEANAIRTIDGVLKVIKENVTIKKMIDFEKEYKSKLNIDETIGKMYDVVAQDKSFKRDDWRKFHNFVKRQTILNASNICTGGAYLDLACGKGGDIGKYINLGYKNILAIDSSEKELYERNGYVHRLLNTGFSYQGSFYQNKDIKVTVICGDISKNIRNGECTTNKQDKEKLKLFFQTVEKFDCIAIMFAIHYMFGDFIENTWIKNEIKVESFFNNVLELIKPSGKFIGTYLNMEEEEEKRENDEEDIFSFFRRKEVNEITYRNHGLPFYKIIDKEDHIEIVNDVWGLDNILSEPKINTKIFNENMNDKLVQSVNQSFETMYEDFRMKENIMLSTDEQKLGFRNNYFTFMLSPMKISKRIKL